MENAPLVLLHLQLHRGRENGTSMAAIGEALWIPEREVRAAIAYLVEHDHEPIVCLPCKNGVFLATNKAELKAERDLVWARIRALFKRLRGLRLAQPVIEGQGRLF
jgi:hypothetical protein